MMEMLALYAWTIVSGVLAASALSLLGVHLATRDRAMQTLCVGQGAMVGVLCGVGLQSLLESAPFFSLGPFLSALVVSSLTYLVADELVRKRAASKNTTFAFVFALLLAVGYLVGSLFPALESHMAQIYFGDLATLTETNAKVMAALSVACVGYLAIRIKAVSNDSFELAIFGASSSMAGARAFQFLSIAMLCISVQFVGFLFTIAMLFLPTAILTFVPGQGLYRHLVLTALIASSSTVAGFLLSLQYTRLPTVPAVVAVMFVAGLSILGLERLRLLTRAREAPLPLYSPVPGDLLP